MRFYGEPLGSKLLHGRIDVEGVPEQMMLTTSPSAPSWSSCPSLNGARSPPRLMLYLAEISTFARLIKARVEAAGSKDPLRASGAQIP